MLSLSLHSSHLSLKFQLLMFCFESYNERTLGIMLGYVLQKWACMTSFLTRIAAQVRLTFLHGGPFYFYILDQLVCRN